MPQQTAAKAPQRRTVTKWQALRGYRPISVLCEGYLPPHTVNNGCHTRIPPEAQWLHVHTFDRGHGGGFYIELVEGDTDFWDQCEALGLEIADFRCGVCGKRIKPAAPAVAQHMRPHIDQNRQIQPGGQFRITVGSAPAVDDEAVDTEE